VRRRTIVAGVLVAAALLVPRRAAAQCTISVTPVNFGSYDVFATAPTDAEGSMTFRCAAPQRAFVLIELSTGSGTYAQREMTLDPSQKLFYNLYQDAARTVVFGEAKGQDRYRILHPPIDTDVTITIFGRVPALQDLPVGTYSDTIVATIQF
jgi:spore coat protein U domain-containing protein, fimbrial subunit CupE1/2/3/6